MRSSMRPVVVVGLIVLGVASVVGISEWRSAHAVEVIPWRTDFSAARLEARQNHRAIFAYFTAPYCPPCQQMKHTTWADNTVKEAMEKFVPVKLDIDAQKDLATKYEVTAIPTYLILSDDAEIARRRTGLLYPEEMVDWLEK